MVQRAAEDEKKDNGEQRRRRRALRLAKSRVPPVAFGYTAAFGSDQVRAGDLAARYGGEEFLLILPGSNAMGGKIAAERLRRMIEGLTMPGPNGPFSITSSFGVASVCGPGCASKLKDLIARSDEALYAAKHGGRNRVVAAADETLHTV